MKSWWTIPLGVFIGLLTAGGLLVSLSRPRGEAVQLAALPTPVGLIVHVSGAVEHGGVYTLPVGSRVNDAILAAGGLKADAFPDSLNLAAPLKDGQHIYVPWSFTTPTATNSPGVTATATKSPFININTASQAELESLPGIGAVLAQRIIAYRTRYGPFQSLQDLLKVYGIKPNTLQLIEPYVTFEP